MIGRFLAAALLAALALPAQAQAPSAPPAAAERVYSAAELKSDFEAL
jgi:hypothetical protein